MIERVLVGADGSDVAGHAVDLALRIAATTGAELRAIHVLEEPAMYALAPGFDPKVIEARQRAGERVLQDVLDRAEALDVPATTTLGEGRAAGVILEEADAWDADLVAVGTRGHGALARAIVGSVADEIVRTSPIPVLTARQARDASASASIDRIVLPSDGSREALAAAPLALELAQATGAELDLLFAIPPEMEGGKYLDRPASQIEAFHEEIAAQALDPLEERCIEAGVGYERSIVHDRPGEAIRDRAEDRDADLVVMATHGRGGLGRLLLGSVTDEVVRSVERPLITVQPPKDR